MRRLIPFLTAALVFLSACSPAGKPAWISGKNDLYPPEAFLTGVGQDRERGRAEDRARTEIAKIFQVDILARETSSESHWMARSGKISGEHYQQAVQSELVATTGRALQGVRIAETWRDEKTGEWHALAVLDRFQAMRPLRQEVEEIDSRVSELVRRGDGEKQEFRRLAPYLQALKLLERRSPLASDLRILDPAGRVFTPPHSSAEVASRLDAAAAGIAVSIDLAEDYGGIVRGALMQTLTGLGLRVVPQGEDLTIRGLIGMEAYRQAPWEWRVATAQVEFLDGRGTVLDAVRATAREGAQSGERAETRARERLGEMLADLLIERLGGVK